VLPTAAEHLGEVVVLPIGIPEGQIEELVLADWAGSLSSLRNDCVARVVMMTFDRQGQGVVGFCDHRRL